MLLVNNLKKSFNKNIAVDGVSFEIKKGEVIGLLGPNGAGKSTLIKLIVGLLRKEDGNIKIGGFEHRSREAKKIFSYIPEVPSLYDMLTVDEHLKFIEQAYGLKNVEEKKELLLKRFELDDKRNKLGKELSKGMKQKVSICCGLLPEPDIYFFDEPMIGLDPKAIKELKKMFFELKEQGKSFLISTHLLDSVEHICDRIMVMKNGKMIAIGTIDELKASLGENKDATLEDIFLEVTANE